MESIQCLEHEKKFQTMHLKPYAPTLLLPVHALSLYASPCATGQCTKALKMSQLRI